MRLICETRMPRCSLAGASAAFAGLVTDDHEKINQIAVRVAKHLGPDSPTLKEHRPLPCRPPNDPDCNTPKKM